MLFEKKAREASSVRAFKFNCVRIERNLYKNTSTYLQHGIANIYCITLLNRARCDYAKSSAAS